MFETTLTIAQGEEFAAAGLWQGIRLHDLFATTAVADPDRTALVDVKQRTAYGELATITDDLALGLLDLGVRHGDVVSVQLPNWWEFVAVMLAVERIGAVLNPLAPIYRAREVGVMFRLARPVLVVTAGEFRGFGHASMMQDLKGPVPSLRTVVTVGATAEGDLSLDDVARRGRESGVARDTLDLLAPDANDVALLMFTSGTTGAPKGVLHTHNTLIAANRAMIDAQHLGGAEVYHMASTFAHLTGYLFGARMCLQSGGTGVFQDHWDPAAFVELAEREQVTMSCGATPFLADLTRVSGLEGRNLSAFRIFGCFGAPIPLPLLSEAKQRLSVRVMPGWGMTETALATTISPADPPDKVVTTDGRMMAGMEVQVVGDDGREVPAGVEGDLLCRGAAAFVGYLQGREFTESCCSPGGWLHTGDRARLDAEGFLRITGRTKDVLIRGGENVPVKQIEDVLASHPGIRTVALVGVPHARLGEIGCACVIAEAGAAPTLPELATYLEEHKVTRQYWPERLEVFDELPTTPSGKIQKFKLRQMLSAGADRA